MTVNSGRSHQAERNGRWMSNPGPRERQSERERDSRRETV